MKTQRVAVAQLWLVAILILSAAIMGCERSAPATPKPNSDGSSLKHLAVEM